MSSDFKKSSLTDHGQPMAGIRGDMGNVQNIKTANGSQSAVVVDRKLPPVCKCMNCNFERIVHRYYNGILYGMVEKCPQCEDEEFPLFEEDVEL